MLERQTKTISSSQFYGKISHVSCAFDDTFIFVCMDYPYSIVHISAQGKKLYEKSFSAKIQQFGMLSPKQVIVVDPSYQPKICIIDLQNRHTIHVPHKFSFNEIKINPCMLYTFCESRMFLVLQRGGKNINRFILTYYNYINIRQNTEPVVQWDMQLSEQELPKMVAKIDNHSNVAFWSYQQDKQINFSYFGLGKKLQIVTGTVKVENDLHFQHKVEGNIQLRITNLWKTMPNTYMLVAQSNKNSFGNKCCDQNEIINNNYIVTSQTQNSKGRIRQTHFIFGKDAKGVPYNDQLINCFNLGTVSVFHTFSLDQNGQYPIFYVHNRSEDIIAVGYDSSSCFSNNYFFPGWDDTTMIENQSTNTSRSSITFTISRSVLRYTLKEISMCFLEHLNEDFDDDLLQDAIQLII